MTLLAALLILLFLIGVPAALLWPIALIAPPVHMYRQLRGAYAISRFAAAWRMIVLLGMTTVSGTLFFLFLLWLEME